MPLIKPRSERQDAVRHITRLHYDNNETLYAYAAFIEERPEYVLNQLIGRVLAKDREFVQWRRDHPGSFVRRGRKTNGGVEAKMNGGGEASVAGGPN